MTKIFVKTFGCTLNQKETEEMCCGLNVVDNFKKIKEASYILVNTCGVKEQTETKVINFLNKLKKEGVSEKKIIITGCLIIINKEPMKKIFPNARYLKKEEIIKLFDNIRKTKKIKNTEIIAISSGCIGNCSYCAVKFARGKLKSKSVLEIVKEINYCLSGGAKEILLTSQDNSCYGLDINENIIDLLKKIISIKKEFKLRLGMGNPFYFYKYRKELVEIYKSEKMYKFIHIPIQSGSNKILEDMNRTYDIELCYKLIKYLRKNLKNLTIATDVIAGFPTETEEDFKKTIKLLKKLKLDVVNISRYGERKNTESLKHKNLHSRIKKERSRILTKLCNEITREKNKKFLGKIKIVYVNEKGRNCMLARTEEYKQVIVSSNLKLGEIKKVKIKDTEIGYLIS